MVLLLSANKHQDKRGLIAFELRKSGVQSAEHLIQTGTGEQNPSLSQSRFFPLKKQDPIYFCSECCAN